MITAAPRQKRALPAENRAFRITERDRGVLHALVRMRFLTTGQIAMLAFAGSRWAATKRCRKLLDGGLVRVWVRSLSEENVYTLTRSGADAAVEGDEAGCGIFIPRSLDGNLDHLLAINEVRLAVALGLAEVGSELLWWRSDWDLRAGVRGATVPDAVFLVEFSGKQRAFALEVEHAGKSPRKFLGKVLRYRAMGARLGALYGVSALSLLVVGRDDRTVERYRSSVANASLGFGVWFTSLGEVTRSGALAPIWRQAHGAERYSLRDL